MHRFVNRLRPGPTLNGPVSKSGFPRWSWSCGSVLIGVPSISSLNGLSSSEWSVSISRLSNHWSRLQTGNWPIRAARGCKSGPSKLIWAASLCWLPADPARLGAPCTHQGYHKGMFVTHYRQFFCSHALSGAVRRPTNVLKRVCANHLAHHPNFRVSPPTLGNYGCPFSTLWTEECSQWRSEESSQMACSCWRRMWDLFHLPWYVPVLCHLSIFTSS